LDPKVPVEYVSIAAADQLAVLASAEAVLDEVVYFQKRDMALVCSEQVLESTRHLERASWRFTQQADLALRWCLRAVRPTGTLRRVGP
jgi:hypothetical protein